MTDPNYRGLRNSLAVIVPNWLSNRPQFQVAYKILWVVALMGDAMIETAIEGVWASWPGKGTPDATTLIGQTRGLTQGPFERLATFFARLINWLTTWYNAGSDVVLAQQIQSFLTDPDGHTLPQVRIVDRYGQFTTVNPDGSTSTVRDVAWNWDGVTCPERNDAINPWWSDIWIIVHSPPTAWVTYASTADPGWLAAWANKQQGIGHAVDPASVDAILNLVRTFKGIHCYVVAIIWNTDGTLFVPGLLGNAGNPDGTWAHWGKWVGGVCVPARTTQTGGGTVRYWTPEPRA